MLPHRLPCLAPGYGGRHTRLARRLLLDTATCMQSRRSLHLLLPTDPYCGLADKMAAQDSESYRARLSVLCRTYLRRDGMYPLLLR